MREDGSSVEDNPGKMPERSTSLLKQLGKLFAKTCAVGMVRAQAPPKTWGKPCNIRQHQQRYCGVMMTLLPKVSLDCAFRQGL